VLVSTSLAVPYLYAKGQHISMDLVHRALPGGARRGADVVTAAATAFLGLILSVTAFRSMGVAIEGGLTGSGTFSIPLWIPDAVLFLTGALLTLVALLFPPGGTGGEKSTEPSTEDAAAGPGDRPASAGEGEPNR
ncbi:MAG: TRAP transporter small permease, partial [Stackebrandtia sp.]